MEAAGAMDAKNAPTAPCKTRRRVSHSYHRPSSRGLKLKKCHPCSRLTVLPMFPVAPTQPCEAVILADAPLSKWHGGRRSGKDEPVRSTRVECSRAVVG